MLTVLWAAKGGSGATVTSCIVALLMARREPALLVDLGGDAPAALGLAEPPGPGVHDWVASATAAPEALEALAVSVDSSLRLVPRGREAVNPEAARWAALGRVLAQGPPTVVDAGSAPVPRGVLDAADHRIVVTRPCYLALRRAAVSGVEPTGVVVVNEPGRALRALDISRALGAPVVAEVMADPAVARAVDAGLLAARLPKYLSAALQELAR